MIIYQISHKEIKFTDNASKSILINQGKIWIKTKKNNNGNQLFDITMGGKHTAEICEFTKLLLLNGLRRVMPESDVNIYRDNCIVAITKKQLE